MNWIDLHVDTLWRMHDHGYDPLEPAARLHIDLPRLIDAHVRSLVWAIFVDPAEHTGSAGTACAMRMFGLAHELAQRAGGRLRIVRTPDDLERCLAGEAIGMVLGLEGAHPLLGESAMLRGLHALGLRVLTLTWNHSNAFATGCGEAEPEDPGLTDSGAQLIELAQELGIVIDLAHASSETIAQVVARMRRPFLVSHTACRALAEHRRNLSDAQLSAVAAAGGLIGICAYPGFLAPGETEVGIARMVDHICHAVRVAGDGAVAIGTDFDGITTLPADLSGVQEIGRIAEEMIRRDLTPEQIEGICWGNAARVLRAGIGPATP